MNFILKSSLEHRALVKIASLLWNQHDIRDFMTEFSDSAFSESNVVTIFSYYNIPTERGEKWLKIEDQVIKKMAELAIPLTLKEKMLGSIQSVGIQIFKWMKYHLDDCWLNLDLPNEFCWTPQGTIDKKKTAEMLIRDDSIDIATRYHLACLYCFEDDAKKLGINRPKSERMYFYHDSDFSRRSHLQLVGLWTHHINEECDALYKHQLYLAAVSGNKTATEYFLQKLDIKEKFLFTTASDVTKIRDVFYRTTESQVYYNEVLCFLISQMSSDQQVDLFKQRPLQVVCCLLDWPLQSLFVETVKLLWNFLPQSDYHFVLIKILRKEFLGYKDYNYKKAFRDVWHQIPDGDKSFIINDGNIDNLLDMLLRIKDKENIKLIFQDATRIEKHRHIFSERGQFICRDMIHDKEWDLLKFFVQFFISSKTEIIKFKEQYQKHFQVKKYCLKEGSWSTYGTGDWGEFFKILDDLVHGYDERNFDQGESSSETL